jgi:hypothetical protein
MANGHLLPARESPTESAYAYLATVGQPAQGDIAI